MKKRHKKMVPPEGLEPTTFCSEDRRSNPLSYGGRYLYYNIFSKLMHQSWGLVMLASGVIFGMILGMVLKINYFNSPIWLLLVGMVFIFMYLKPRFLLVGLCFLAGMVLAFFRVATVLSLGSDNFRPVDDGTENLILGVRDWFSDRVGNVLPEREAALGKSYLLGVKTGLDKELSENLKKVGLTHIVVASGAHLSILVEIARKIFGRLSRFSGLLFSVLFILFFMAMVGFTPSILRAGIMAILTLVSWYGGRKIKAWRIILMVAAFTLILEPTFISSLSWLLSFASYIGIMILGPRLTEFFYGEKKPGFFASVILTTIAATLMTLPITLYYFGQVSIISVVANLLILPTLPYAMGLTFLTGVFSGVPAIQTVASFLTTKMLDFHILVVEFLSSFEQFLIKVKPYEPKMFLLYIIILLPFLVGFIWRYSGRRRHRGENRDR